MAVAGLQARAGEPMSPEVRREHDDGNITLDARDDDWAWRRRIRSNPHSHRIYRIVVGIVGLVIVVGGLALVPLPGPGWVIVFLGLAVWASEFEWAQRLLHFAKRTLRAWSDWLKPQPWWVKALVAAVTVLLLAVIFWLLFRVSGVPGFFPDGIQTWMTANLGLR